MLQDLIALCGLGMAGLAQTHRAIVLIVGPPGSGKGGPANTVVRALGDRAMGVPSAWVERRGSTEIDSTTAEALESQPAVVAIGELGSSSSLTHQRVLALTGNEPLSARRPHASNIYGTLQARYVYGRGYRPPEGDAATREEVLRDMDPLTAWIEDLPDTFHGTAMSEVLTRAREDLGMEKLSSTKLGKSVKASRRWVKGRGKTGEMRDKRCVYLADSPEAQLL